MTTLYRRRQLHMSDNNNPFKDKVEKVLMVAIFVMGLLVVVAAVINAQANG